MIPERLLPMTASWFRPDSWTTDAHGNAVPDWGSASATGITCRIEQSSRSETDDETRDALVQTATMWTNTLGIAGRDRIVITGAGTWEVDGPPAVVAGTTGAHHLEATLRRVDG